MNVPKAQLQRKSCTLCIATVEQCLTVHPSCMLPCPCCCPGFCMLLLLAPVLQRMEWGAWVAWTRVVLEAALERSWPQKEPLQVLSKGLVGGL